MDIRELRKRKISALYIYITKGSTDVKRNMSVNFRYLYSYSAHGRINNNNKMVGESSIMTG